MSLSRTATIGLVLIAAAAIVISCTGSRSSPPPEKGHGRTNPYSPIVDVYVVGDHCEADPPSVFAHARSGKGKAGAFVPSVINWFGPTGKNLMVKMKDPNQQCLRKDGPQCHGDHCIAVTNVDYRGPAKAECKYKLWIEGQQEPTDPVVIVDNCCDAMDPLP